MNSFARSNQEFNPAHCLVQFVCFETALSANQFHPTWQQYASSFLSKGFEVLILNEAQESHTQSVPFRFISRNWRPKRRFKNAIPNGQIAGNVTFGPVRVTQAGGFAFSIYILPSGTDPRATSHGSKLFVLSHGSPLSFAEVKAAQRASEADGALFFARSAGNRESLFDWLLELRNTQLITVQRREELQTVLLPRECSVERHSMHFTRHFVSLSSSVLQYVHCFVRWLSSSFDHHE